MPALNAILRRAEGRIGGADSAELQKNGARKSAERHEYCIPLPPILREYAHQNWTEAGMTKPDNKLVRECLSGSREAWEALVTRYSRLIYGIALRRGLSQDDAADVFQTVCVKLLANLEKLKDDQHLTGWMITTAKNECTHLFRQKQRLHMPLPFKDGEELMALAADDPWPQEILLRLEEEQLVRREVENLSGRCRQLIDLLYLADPPLSYEDVSRMMEMPVGSIGPTRARCLKCLKERLEKLGF
jgi:RNA polymerase sigma factor (sigma-70 family)